MHGQQHFWKWFFRKIIAAKLIETDLENVRRGEFIQMIYFYL